MRVTIAAAGLTALLVAGCSWVPTLDRDAQDLRIDAKIRDTVAAMEAQRAHRRRLYIDQRIDQVIKNTNGPDDRLRAIETQLGQLETNLETLSRQPALADAGGSGAPAPEVMEELERIRRDSREALDTVATLLKSRDGSTAQIRARIERLEFRTRDVPFPQQLSQKGLHLASYRTHGAALTGWEVLAEKYPDVLNGYSPTYIETETVSGRFVRLFVAVGEDTDRMIQIRNVIRTGGDYAMVLPIDTSQNSALAQPRRPRIVVPGS